jgi:dTDP-4-dehydrorhamnose reductase
MCILLLGKNGQLGWELRRTLAPLGDLIALDYPEIDLLREAATRQIVKEIHPQVIVNAAAYTAVDQAENEPDLAYAINAIAPGYLVEEARTLGALYVHFSTDYVFDGTKGTPYLERDIPNPLSMYGKSKLEGERNIEQVGEVFLILRTSWLYSLRRDSFVIRVLEWSRQQEVMRVVDDQVGNPTWARMLAEAVAQMLAKGGENVVDWLGDKSGVYHLAGGGFASRYEWAKVILKTDPNKREQVVKELLPASTTDFSTPAVRPLYSALNCARFSETFGLRLPGWEAALKLALDGC